MIQMLTPYESNNTMRFITGISAGFALMTYTRAFIISAKAEMEVFKKGEEKERK